jgi:hypothetical protein
MGSARSELSPHMRQYAERFDDRGDIHWLPYLMYFHPANHRSEVVNTDRLGFRYSHGPEGVRAAAGDLTVSGPVRIMAGSSTVFGIGASSDAATLSSRLWSRHAPSLPWLNFGGRSFNSAQELILFALYRHLLPDIDQVVLFSGFNDLGLARLPASLRGDHGGFFNSADFFGRMNKRGRRGPRQPGPRQPGPRQPGPRQRGGDVAEPAPTLREQIDLAADLTARHLAAWKALAAAAGARLTFVLQPLATWIRDEPAPQERRLFEELDRIADFSGVYGDIANRAVAGDYAAALTRRCAAIDVSFVDFAPLLAAAVDPGDWVFVDRIHFTDLGHEVAATLLKDALSL